MKEDTTLIVSKKIFKKMIKDNEIDIIDSYKKDGIRYYKVQKQKTKNFAVIELIGVK
jgi:hypothetical protein